MKRFDYIGINPEGFDDKAAAEGESANALVPFTSDPYGCRDPMLTEKKRKRNPFRRRHAYEISNPALADFLRYCPISGQIYKYKLPWE